MSIWIRRGLWALPLYGLLTFLSTLTHQPDPTADFQGYAEYITTDTFLAGHLIGSIVGSGVGALGFIALAAYLAGTRAGAARSAVATALTVVGLVMIASVFGAAAFAQPAIGEAQLGGAPNAEAFNDAVYDVPLFATASVGILLYSAGSIVFGTAIWRASALPRWTGVLLGASGPLISLFGLFIGQSQTVGSLLLLGAGLVIARTPSRQPAGHFAAAPSR
jgi:hypothetical protein